MAQSAPISCPSCGAPQPVPLSLRGVHRCGFCGSSFHVSASGKALEGDQSDVPRPAGNRLLLWLTVGALLVSGVGLSLLLWRPPKEPSGGGDGGGATSPAVDLSGSGVSGGGVSLPALASPTPETVATAEFIYHSSHVSSIGSLWLYGVVKNTSPYPIGAPEVIAVFKNAAGEDLYLEHGYPQVQSLAPGQKTEVTVLSAKPKPHASIAFEVVARRFTGGLEPALGLRVEAGTPYGKYGGVFFEGKVVNDGEAPARFVRVHAAAYDADDKLVGLGNGYAKAERIEPGASARYQVGPLFFGGKAVRYDLRVDGSVAN